MTSNLEPVWIGAGSDSVKRGIHDCNMAWGEDVVF